jgi:hypothetical protein
MIGKFHSKRPKYSQQLLSRGQVLIYTLPYLLMNEEGAINASSFLFLDISFQDPPSFLFKIVFLKQASSAIHPTLHYPPST